MKIAGELQTAAGGGHDVFDGYVVEIRYAVKVDGGGGAYRDAEDSFALRNKDPRFFFELPDTSQLALDKPLQLRVYAPSGKEVFASEQMLATLLRSEKPLEIRIREVEPPPVSTPVQARGRLQWKDAPDKTSGFDGFSVLATFSARDGDDGDYQPRIASFTQGSGNQFAVPLPAREQLAPGPVALAAKYPDGQIAATASFEIDALREPVTLVVAQPQQPIVVRGDARADEAAPVRIKGKVVDLAGQTPIRNRQVILWGQGSGDGRLQPVLVATTDAAGNFAGAWPKAHFQRGFATVAGTRQANTDQALAVTLEPVAGEQDPPLGSFPTFVYLVVSVDTATDSAKDDDCACHDTGTPRQPDPEDLVANPNAYSQDIGPNCVNFTTPNRTLEEFVYTLVVRTTDPQIKGTTLSDLERRRTLLDHMRDVVEDKPRLSMAAAGNPTLLRTAITPAEAAIGNMATIANTAASTGEFKIKAVKEAALSPYAISKALPTDWANVFKTVAARGVLSADNSVDWDSSPTFYQAATIAHGHILYYKQIWKADGYSLGDLLYSLPLAPGQKKQIVIFDWDRTEYGRRDEDSHEDEALDSYLSHNRDVVDITHASLGEHMKGGSTSHTSGEAGGIGAGIGALLGPVMIGVAGGYSASSGSASSSAWQDSSRDVSASGLNQLRDMIQQGASAVRNQRSTVVQTARQTERFKVESEVVANHNHCHAITIEYFEVLRHYTIEQQLTQVQECLFIPLLMSSFDIAKVIRWRDILRSALLLPPRSRVSIFQQHPLQRGIDACERIFLNYEGSDFPTTTYASESLVSLSGELRISFRLNRPLDDDDNADDPARQDALMTMAVFQSSVGWNLWWPLLPWGPNETFEQFFAHQKVKYKNKIFEERVAPMLAEAVIDQLSFTAVSATGGRLPLQVDTTLVSDYKRDIELYCTVRPKGPVNVRRDQIDFIEISTSLDLSQSAQSKIIIRSASLRYSTPHLNGYLAQDYRVDNDLKPNDPVTVYTPLSVEEKRNPREEDKRFSKLLMEHLDSHLEHYHKAIWAQMDPDRRYMLLDGFLAPNANGKSVASVVENRVIGIAGNCLIMPVAPGYKLDPTYTYEPQRDERGDPVLDDRGNVAFEPTSLLDHYKPLVPPAPFRVSVPTRGVFAEAVMGACNSCEKWDESRYWKWEEHPIPEDPTPIAPIQTRPPERSDPGALTPTAFPTPMINIQNAPNAPDPGATLTGALGVLGKSDLFKDITGLDQTQKNALQAMLSNQESAKHFADKAAELAVQAQNLKSAPTTIDSIKKSMADGTIDKATGQRLIADAYRAQINGKTAEDKPGNTANASELGHAAADAVRSGREVKATQTHPDGTSTSIEQKPDEITEGKGSPTPTEHIIIVGGPCNFMNGFGKVVEDPPGSGSFAFKLNKAPATLTDVESFCSERLGNETHDKYWANFLEPVPRIFHNGLAKPKPGDVVTVLVYYPPYIKRNAVDWAASPWNALAWRNSPWVDGKNPYDWTVRAGDQNTFPVKSTPTPKTTPLKPSTNYATVTQSEERINHELLMRCTSEARRPGQSYEMRPASNSTWIDALHDLPRRIVYGNLLGGKTAKVEGVLVKLLMVSDKKQITDYLTTGKISATYWRHILDTYSEETMSTGDGPDLDSMEGAAWDGADARSKSLKVMPKFWKDSPSIDRTKIKVSRLDYFGHSNQAAFFLKYGWENQKGDANQPHAEVYITDAELDAALTPLAGKVFTPTAEAVLWGCSLGLQMAPTLRKHISKVTASEVLTSFDEVILDTTSMPKPVTGDFKTI
jgi:hypothetical protein